MSTKPAHEGLPEHLFAYLSSITPLINIDILLVDARNRVLLTWRDDGTYGPGWHVPGGIVRFKENLISRVAAVCKSELSVHSISHLRLLVINQIMNPSRDYRGHFLSFLFMASPEPALPASIPRYINNQKAEWFSTVPDPLIKQHRRYLSIIRAIQEGRTDPHFCDMTGNLLSDYSPSHEQDS